MNYYIIAGEASGDLYGANLIKALQQQDPDADFRCWGGDRMQAAGGTLVKHYRDLAFMGFIKAFACNKHHRPFKVTDNEFNSRFFRNYGYRIDSSS